MSSYSSLLILFLPPRVSLNPLCAVYEQYTARRAACSTVNNSCFWRSTRPPCQSCSWDRIKTTIFHIRNAFCAEQKIKGQVSSLCLNLIPCLLCTFSLLEFDLSLCHSPVSSTAEEQGREIQIFAGAGAALLRAHYGPVKGSVGGPFKDGRIRPRGIVKQEGAGNHRTNDRRTTQTQEDVTRNSSCC